MRFIDIVKMCVDSLKRRKGRTILTVLGVFIGCTSIIVMVSIGAGMRESQEQMIADMGDISIIEVYGNGNNAKLNDDAVKNFKDIAGVKAVMPKLGSNQYGVSLTAGTNERYTSDWGNVIGVDLASLEDMGYEIVAGRYPSAVNEEVAVGEYFAYNFYDSIMPPGKNYVNRYEWDEATQSYKDPGEPFFKPEENTKITLYFYDYNSNSETKTPFEIDVVGRIKEDYGKGWETSEGVMMDISQMKKILAKMQNTVPESVKLDYDQIYVKCSDIEILPDVEQAIKDLGYSTYSMASIRDSLEEQTRQIELMLGGLGAISLLVAAIGIANTMVMSVTERTREIGIMKAIGCYVKDIRLMFLLEAGSIGLVGGILGLIFSFIVSVGINLFSFGGLGPGFTWELLKMAILGGEQARISVITPMLAVGALLFSFLVGLVSGYQPANKAVKIPALEAIRNE